MPQFDGSRKVIEVLDEEAPKKCPVCGNDEFEKRILSGAKHGKNESFNHKIICSECGENIAKVPVT